jgi:hypothetical protein
MRAIREFLVARIFFTFEASMIRDQLFNVQWFFVKQVCQQWLGALDRQKAKIPGQVVVASAITLILICERYKLNPREVMDIADRVIRRGWELDPRYLRGIREYFKEELPNG